VVGSAIQEATTTASSSSSGNGRATSTAQSTPTPIASTPAALSLVDPVEEFDSTLTASQQGSSAFKSCYCDFCVLVPCGSALCNLAPLVPALCAYLEPLWLWWSPCLVHTPVQSSLMRGRG
jgi:hypothetical protein